jgi:hypothetical protein
MWHANGRLGRIRIQLLFGVLGFIAVLEASPLALAQGLAEILGTVRDQSGAVIPSARIVLTSEQQGFVRTALSGGEGLYDFSAVPVGSYSVRVEKDGFNTYSQTGIVLQADVYVRVDIELRLGTSTQTITITGSAPLLETTSSTMENTIDRERVQNLPLNGRDARQLISLVPGGVTQGPLDQFIASPSFSVNGAREDQVNFRLDGGEHMDTWFGSGLPYPNPDALQDVQVAADRLMAPQFFRQLSPPSKVKPDLYTASSGATWTDYIGPRKPHKRTRHKTPRT